MKLYERIGQWAEAGIRVNLKTVTDDIISGAMIIDYGDDFIGVSKEGQHALVPLTSISAIEPT